MEWNGINLNGYHQLKWQKRTINILVGLLITGFLNILLSVFIYKLSETEKIYSDNLIQQIKQQEALKVERYHQTENLKQEISTPFDMPRIKQGEVSQIIQFLQALPIQGGLEQITLTQSNNLQLLLIGKLAANDFEQFEKYIKEQRLIYQIIQLQSDEHHQLQFNILIDWRVDNENVVK